jgi:uncharacterized protein YozE (UPF0346 family)
MFTYHPHTKERLGLGLSLGNLAFRGLDGVFDSHNRDFFDLVLFLERTLDYVLVLSLFINIVIFVVDCSKC